MRTLSLLVLVAVAVAFAAGKPAEEEYEGREEGEHGGAEMGGMRGRPDGMVVQVQVNVNSEDISLEKKKDKYDKYDKYDMHDIHDMGYMSEDEEEYTPAVEG
ncbi:uncharacterized protein [Penaeus vannamei]|uniref:uncharacterized protein n=1 Tax=Penaeus vannamei TaxID=6689 RepID=UPI00387F84A2